MYTANHQANEDTIVAYTHNILLPNIMGIHKKMQLSDTFPALVLLKLNTLIVSYTTVTFLWLMCQQTAYSYYV